MNTDYYKHWVRAHLGVIRASNYANRCHGIQTWGFAVPNSEAIHAIAHLGTIVEMGAGTGYWAKLLSEEGAQVEAYDKAPPGEGSRNTYRFKHSPRHFDVREGDESLLPSLKADVLLLVWPCYDTPFAYRCLRRFTGKYVAYVGEGPGGCTADDRFHERLRARWTSIVDVRIPNWDGIHDYLEVFQRTSTLPR